MSAHLLLLAAAFAVCLVLIIGLLQLVKRSSVRRAARIRQTGALPRWSTLHLNEVARMQTRPRRLPRHVQGFRPWEDTEAGSLPTNQPDERPQT